MSEASREPRVPDVTVILPVYNTLGYLRPCLESLVGQSIGPDRMQVVAVDDGSTDGSQDELDRFAEEHPGLFDVVHQANSGGPASPNNRGLGLARGRYVFFVGSDDYLGTEALERLVSAADEYDADVVAGKWVGVNDRQVHQALYESTRLDVTFRNSTLAYSVSNAKLFRRTLVEEHHLRFPEDQAFGSDQPFTIEACLRARRVVVLADYTYYYAVRREDAGNVTVRSSPETRLECTGRIMDRVAALVPPGEDRDAILVRHFSRELNRVARRGFADLPVDRQRQVAEGVAELADRYWTPWIQQRMPVLACVRIALLRAGALEALEQVADLDEDAAVPVTVRDEQLLAVYPGLDDPRWQIPDEVYQLRREAARRCLEGALSLIDAKTRRGPGGPEVELRLRSNVRGTVHVPPDICFRLGGNAPSKEPAGAVGVVRLPRRGAPTGRRAESVSPEGLAGPAELTVVFELSARLDRMREAGAAGRRLRLRGYVQDRRSTYQLPVGGAAIECAPLRHRRRTYRVRLDRDALGQLQLVVEQRSWKRSLRSFSGWSRHRAPDG